MLDSLVFAYLNPNGDFFSQAVYFKFILQVLK